jgi:hypothetical protein
VGSSLIRSEFGPCRTIHTSPSFHHRPSGAAVFAFTHAATEYAFILFANSHPRFCKAASTLQAEYDMSTLMTNVTGSTHQKASLSCFAVFRLDATKSAQPRHRLKVAIPICINSSIRTVLIRSQKPLSSRDDHHHSATCPLSIRGLSNSSQELWLFTVTFIRLHRETFSNRTRLQHAKPEVVFNATCKGRASAYAENVTCALLGRHLSFSHLLINPTSPAS